MMPDIPDDDRPALSPKPRQRHRTRGAHEVRAQRRRWLTVGLSALAFGLVVNTVVGDNGYLSTIRARREQAVLEHAVRRLRLENRSLQLDSRRLRDDPAALEETARRTLGFVRPGETLLIVRDARPVGPDRPQQ
jgi:cell division protein FtsB